MADTEQPPTQTASVNGQPPHVTLIVGVNGTGKTTTVGKLARLIKDSGKTPLICAADTFRAAAVEQLQVWATRAGVDFIRAQGGADPAAVVYDAQAEALCAISISGLSARMSSERLAPLGRLVSETARLLTEALGGTAA